MVSSTLNCVEGEPFAADGLTRERLNAAMTRLQREIRFRSWPLAETTGGRMVLRGIVGTIALSDGRILEVAPKTSPEEDWVRAILNLLVGSDRIDAAGERSAGLAPERKSILPVLAAIYASRLERALRRDGPIVLMRRERHVKSVLKGKLDATDWLRHALHKPNLFPAESNVLAVDNDFAQALAAVAGGLATQALSTTVRGRLFAAQKALRPGSAVHTRVAPGVEHRHLPAQWAAYEPAWAVASAVLGRRSLLGPSGLRKGLSIAIEAWPLLERLLERSLRAVAGYYIPSAGDPLVRVPVRPNRRTLLKAPGGALYSSHHVEPDGCLQIDGVVQATFDAKYKKREGTPWPSREDVYQVVASAAAFGAPLAVLIYPEKFEPMWWEVQGLKGCPNRVAAIGLGLFSYRAGDGDRERGRAILDLLISAGCAPVPACFAGSVSA